MPVKIDKFSVDFLDKEVTEVILRSSANLLDNDKWRAVVWPATTTAEGRSILENKNTTLTLIPLERVGAPAGASGSKVLVAYFNNEGELWCSKPLILKYDQFTPGKDVDDKLKLENENFQKVKPFVGEFESNFASPIQLFEDVHTNYRCLWSPFLSTTAAVKNRSERLELDENDLWKYLTKIVKPLAGSDEYCKQEEQLERLFKAVYDYMRSFHEKFGLATDRIHNVEKLYRHYFRTPDKWIQPWQLIWGTERLIIGSSDKINPIFVFEELIKQEHNFHCGAVHGDLHPKNILLDGFERPQIIDFGWSNDDAHVLVDFTLMEANLRFVTLHNPVPDDDLNVLASMLTLKQLETGDIKNEYLNFVRKAIVNVRKKAISLFNDEDAFESEYAISLFAVSFGLLKFLENFKNQPATRQTVLTLANHVYELFLRK